MIFLKRRRSSPTIENIKQEMAVDDAIYQRAKKHCENAGIKMTKLRCVILQGCIKTDHDATAVEISKILSAMIQCHTPSLGSIQRNLNMFSEHGILRRYIDTNNVLRYRIALNFVGPERPMK